MINKMILEGLSTSTLNRLYLRQKCKVVYIILLTMFQFLSVVVVIFISKRTGGKLYEK